MGEGCGVEGEGDEGCEELEGAEEEVGGWFWEEGGGGGFAWEVGHCGCVGWGGGC